MRKFITNFIILTICITIVAIGASLGLKAAIGVGAWDAVGQSMASVLGIKIGTFSMVLNSSCVLIQILILKRDFKAMQLLQVFIAVLIGSIINFMVYGVFSNFVMNSYFTKLVFFILAQLISAIGISILMIMDFISFPLESLCMVVSKKINKNFGVIRQLVDIISIAISLAIALIFKDNITVREGTVISMLIFGPMLNLFMKLFTPALKKLNLVEENLDLSEDNLELAKENL